MSRKRFATATLLVTAVVATWALGGRAQPQGAGEKVGQKLDEAGRRIRRGAEQVGAGVREGFDRTRAAVHNMGVQSRVYGRIHWDKALTDAAIELEVKADGATVLRGTVPDVAAKQKAVALARETVGVTRVIDQLTVPTPASTGTAPKP
jgi:hyperosmotically inducible periplasmic protein